MERKLTLDEFIEMVNNFMELQYIEENKTKWTDEDRDIEQMMNILIKCKATMDNNPKNKEFYNEIIAWFKKWFGEEKTIDLENSINRYVNNLRDKYTDYLLDESHGI